ncbi:hypothetical protein NE237_013934 [Protea cynaroides]|uniref:Uncharacterized protein n=1 Tax=Protea cynaroides TaxID=273540 RepID=A0A9Q0JZ15_9MAGN|nr:hypothetical protein NE237_013934 [Protea cynaroides]
MMDITSSTMVPNNGCRRAEMDTEVVALGGVSNPKIVVAESGLLALNADDGEPGLLAFDTDGGEPVLLALDTDVGGPELLAFNTDGGGAGLLAFNTDGVEPELQTMIPETSHCYITLEKKKCYYVEMYESSSRIPTRMLSQVLRMMTMDKRKK